MQRNPLTNNDLTTLYNCRGYSIFVESSLQITPFMQNKPKFYNTPTILSPCPKWTYSNFLLFDLPKNEPKQTQNEPNEIPSQPKTELL